MINHRAAGSGSGSIVVSLNEPTVLTPVTVLQHTPVTTGLLSAPNPPSAVAVLLSVKNQPHHVDTARCNSTKATIVALLMVQNCAAVLFLRYTRTRTDVAKYTITALVLSQEILKLVLSSFWLLIDCYQNRHVAKHSVVRAFVAESCSREALMMLVPAVLFTVQNGLLVVALQNLEPTLFQLLYQSKTIVTALLMIAMLGRSFSRTKWMCLVILVGGVVVVQLRPSKSKAVGDENTVIGILSVAACVCSSSFAGVFMEKLFKDLTRTVSLSARNVHLSAFSVLTCFVSILWSFFTGPHTFSVVLPTITPKLGALTWIDSLQAAFGDFFIGFDAVVIVLILNQAAGGILVALVIKYADNIVKGIATALAIIASGIVSHMLFDFYPDPAFLVGGSMIVAAAVCYSIVD